MKDWVIFLLVICLCTGCGIHNQAGEATDLSAVSGNAGNVSNQKSVSGSAGAISVPPAEASDRNALCNGKNYYESVYDDEDEHWTITQRKMDGTVEQEYHMKDYGELAYVREDELFYVTERDSSHRAQMWRIPIRHTASGDELVVVKAKKILTEKPYEGILEYDTYVDDRYILYISGCYSLRVFDRKTEKFLKIQDVDDKKGLSNEIYSPRQALIGDTLFFSCKYSGLYSYTLGEKKVKKVDGRKHGAYNYFVCPELEQVYYEVCEGCDNGKEHGDFVLYCYDLKTGKKKRFMTEEQWKQTFERLGIWEKYQEYWCEEEKEFAETEKEKLLKPEDAPLPKPSCFLDGNRLYAMSEGGLVLSIDLAGDGEPRYEKDLSECMHRLNYGSYEVVKIDRGICYFDYEYEWESEREAWEDDIHIYGYYDMAAKKYVQTNIERDE